MCLINPLFGAFLKSKFHSFQSMFKKNQISNFDYSFCTRLYLIFIFSFPGLICITADTMVTLYISLCLDGSLVHILCWSLYLSDSADFSRPQDYFVEILSSSAQQKKLPIL